jgi:hypothetical protein
MYFYEAPFAQCERTPCAITRCTNFAVYHTSYILTALYALSPLGHIRVIGGGPHCLDHEISEIS